MPRWPHDDPASLAAFYGDPDKGEPGKQLKPVIPPFQMYYAGKPIAKIMFHVKAAGALAAALDEIWRECGRDQHKVDRLGLSVFSGAYNPRYVRGYEPGNKEGRKPRWSNHAYGAAIDFDAEHNGFNTGHGTMPQLAVAAFKRQGALWGGDYQGRTDPMHFEFCSRAPTATPLSFLGEVQADGDSDQSGAGEVAGSDAPAGTPAGGAAPSAGGFFGRVRNWVTAGASSIGLTSLGAMTNGEVVAMLLGFVLLILVAGFLISLWLWGKQSVADWIAKHIA
ncbi:hypothetical protein AC629_40430 [Bradyrhizobium sp. NAS80.1]|uniref:M15 family metallopeptidase n=1 Tax=Bradyrhizobium sp. NAS80.1 TaxID=1680159 RepID=UPI000964A753|nr:M15 family metallopeptidase [Bradyrhizobium sp. NAS80.1]OKO70394.1 hypothetical protein AC629_40430 [Bradyrhizobium sp. NAS80.1]